MQSQLCLLPYTYHGRGKEHDLAVPDPDQLQVSRGQEEFRTQVSIVNSSSDRPVSAANVHYGSCHMFYPRRVLDINDGKPKWSGINKDSELIDESPEQDKKRKREEDAAEVADKKS